MYLAHNQTYTNGGHILGIYNDYKQAKADLKKYCRFEENSTDWGHFIRWLEPDKPFFNIFFLPETNKDGTPNYDRPKRREVVLGVPVVDGHVAIG